MHSIFIIWHKSISEINQTEHIRKLFLDSLNKASENYKSEQKNNTVENSVKKSLNPSFEYEYDKWDKKDPLKHFIIGKEKLLINKQMLKAGIDEIPNLHGLIAAINKKTSSSQYLADLEKIRKAYVRDVKENYSNGILPRNYEKSSGNAKYSLSEDFDIEQGL